MGDRFRAQTVAAYTRIVKDYPLSEYAEDAKLRLKNLEAPIPEADPVAYARMKYELENRENPGAMSHFWGMFRKSPDVSAAAKSGSPPMTGYRPTVPVSVPSTASGTTGVTADVSVSTVSDSSALDGQPQAPGAQAAPAAGTEPPPSNQPPANQKKQQNKKAPKQK
jgi:outer membrane protein assembly factor BamD